MVAVRRSDQRGYADHGWLRTFHTFSFADYYDPAQMGIGNLRVLNEDRVAPGRGFGTHGHRDMEIVSYVLAGELAHKDSMGNGTTGESGTIRVGDVQRMSAGTGVLHSEFNHSPSEPVHFLQIWLLPTTRGLPPGHEQRHFGAADKRGQLRLIASPDGRDGAVTVHTNASILAGLFDGDEHATWAIPPGRQAYVHVARGSIDVNGHRLEAGDGARVSAEPHVALSGGRDAEVLVFDLNA